MKSLCKILNRWWNILFKPIKDYNVPWSTGDNNPTTIHFIGGSLKMLWHEENMFTGFKQDHFETFPYTLDGIEMEEISFWHPTQPRVPILFGDTITCVGNVVYLEVNGTVIFDNR